ncbi:hypothetical protein PMI42_04216 [Bradyrhizobium sp. YR681]|uniref:hypothetical protein n=1 Tax=Bradyrhizobium sp. YR681 TaxID=1144344 RepID=UPI0002710D04|nr:hypothetical protein [Bradyrhizobium sp. YR681]EJN12422.1 hypothetical protein PMI42_04216 [Bradyrhizobium sp. YR681]
MLLAAPARDAIPAGSHGPAVRVVADTPNSFYVMSQNVRGTAFAYHFIRNVGGNSATDLAGSWPNWRYAGCAEFPSSLMPSRATPLRTFSNDIGAQDYAFVLPTSVGKFAGSYHGVGAGGSLTAESLTIDGQAFDPISSGAIGSEIVLAHSVSITDGTSTVTVTGFKVTINASGIFFDPGTISSAAALPTAYIGMGIATGTFDEGTFTLSSGGTEYKVPISVGSTTYGRIYLQKANMVSLRRTSDGATVRFTTNAPTISGYRRTSVVRDANLDRSKFYFDFGSSNAAFGSVTGIAWSQTCELGATNATAFAANLITNGTFSSDVTGWTATHGGGNIAWNPANGGVLRQTRHAAAIDAGAVQAVPTTIGVPYLLAAETSYAPTVEGSYLNPCSMGLSNAAGGSTSNPTPAYPPVAFDRNGYNAHIVIPTATTQYAMLLMRAGVASGQDAIIDTCDWDNVSMFPLLP